MIIQNNLNALNAHNRLKVNVAGAKKASEQLSSGFRINRAADDPAGLAISEKMRTQIRGLNQAIRNANDGISLIQTAEGALDETHAMCKRLKELSVQMANGTYTDEERKYAQEEVDQIIEEINRIAKATDFNGIKLLDGSLAGNETGSNGSYGASYGVREFSAAFNQYISVAANNSGVSINFTTNASGTGGETAHWDLTGKTLTINLAEGMVYTDAQINALIQKAAVAEVNQTPPDKVEFKSEHGFISAANYTTSKTVAGAMQTATLDILPLMLDGGILGFADKITFTANQYGSHATTSGVFSSITISTTNVKPGEERVTVDTPAVVGTSGAAITLHLSTGVEYTAYSIENLLLKAGFDYSVDMFSTINPSGDNTIKFVKQGSVSIGAGVGFGATGEVVIHESYGAVGATLTPGAAPASWANVSGKNLTWLQNLTADHLAPLAVDAILSALPSFEFYSGSNIQIGLTHGNLGGAAARVSATISTGGWIELSLQVDSAWMAGLTNAAGTAFSSAANEATYKETIAHEMMHAIMFISNTNGMTSLWSDNFPLWFIEGMAQTVAGPGNWVTSSGGLNLNASSTNAQIQAALAKLGDGSGAGDYGAGYLAAMYLGYMTAGGGAVTSANIASGLDKIMGEIQLGKSLNQAIADNTSYTGLTDFQNNFRNDTDAYDFVRDLITAKGSGAGSIIAPLGATPVFGNTYSGSETFLKVNKSAATVRNTYPSGYSIKAGGGRTNAGTPIHPTYTPGSPPPPGSPPTVAKIAAFRTSTTAATINININLPGNLFYIVLDPTDPAPSGSDIKTNGVSEGAVAAGAKTINLTGLDPDAPKVVYILVEGTDGDSNILPVELSEFDPEAIPPMFGGSFKDGQGLGKGVFDANGNGLVLQIGANNAVEQRVTVNIIAMDAESIGLSGFNVSTIENAQNSIDKVDGAIIKVSRQRASLGAMQNRLEHTINSLTVQVENLTAAESQIRDADMAKSMVDYTKYNILQQAAQAMLAQANQAPQAILQLLR